MRLYFLLALLFLTAAGPTGAQTTDQFWGMTSAGGTDNAGTIFSTNNDGTGLTVRHQFPYTVTGPLIGGTRFTELGGKLYGVGEYGGKRDYILFSYDPATGAVARLHDFEQTTGTQPMATLTVFNGKLYGTTYLGGTSDVNDIAGTIFEYDPATSTYTKKHTFTFWQGLRPTKTLTVYDNKLWGVTTEGNMNNSGTLFSFDPATSALSVKDTFYTATGKGSTAVTVFGNKLYGAFEQGGTANGGVWCYDPAVPGSLAIVAPTTFSAGIPGTALIPYGSKLYTTAPYGGTASKGALLSFDPATNALAVLHNFATNGGQNPLSELCASGGALWSVTQAGGTVQTNFSTPGIIYKWDTATSTFTKVHEFMYNLAQEQLAPNGRVANAPFTLYNDTLWSTTQQGGATQRGVLYACAPATSTFVKKKDMGTSNGSAPRGNLLYHNSKFYGYTTTGGANGLGVLFEFNPMGDVYTKLYDFTFINGYNTNGTPVVKNNVLYGLSSNALYNNSPTQAYGAVFSYNLSTSVFTTYNMQPFTTGWNPVGRLVEEPGGTFLGVNSSGATSPNISDGTLFRFNPSNGAITKIQNFALADGRFPNGIMEYNGKYYITFGDGGNSTAGSIMEYTPGFLASERGTLTFSTGRAAVGEVVSYNGKLWGMAGFDGGSPNLGTIYEFNPLSPYTVTKKYNFTLTGGNGVGGSLLLYNNKFYGLTRQGGTATYTGVGVLFEFDPTTSTYTMKTEFVHSNGASPENSLIVAPTGSTPLALHDLNFSAEAVGGKAALRWNCADENIARYGVERSADAARYEALESMRGAASGECSFVDAAPLAGKNFYRLRLVKASGTVAYSGVQRLDFSGGASSTRLLNTAAMGGKIGVETSTSGVLRILSAVGTEVARMRIESGVSWVDVDGLATGVYGVALDGKWVGRFAVAQ